jgi:putative ABC transport system permease protein
MQGSNASFILSFSGSPLLMSYGPLIDKIPGVKAETPVLVETSSEGGVETVFGIDPASFQAIGGPFVWIKGGLFQGPNDVVVDDMSDAGRNLGVGGEVSYLNHKFRISGIVQHGRGARIYVSLPALQEMAGAVNHASIFFIKVDDPKNIDSVMAKLNDTFHDSVKLTRIADLMSLMSVDNIPGLGTVIKIVVFIAVCVGVLVIFLSMYTTITERTREIGVLRSLGASKAFIVILFFEESIVICVLGVLVGLIGSFLVRALILSIFPTLAVLITPDWMLKASAYAILSGIIGSLYPAIKGANEDPIEALAYE